MTTAAHKEKAFEDIVEAHLIDHDWHKAEPRNYDRKRALDAVELMAFVKATQNDAWETLVARRGDDEGLAQARLLDRIVDELNRRGTTDVLRRGIKDQGVPVDLAYFKPAHGLTPELVERYEANRCGVVRQLPYSPDDHYTLDVTLLLNGIPVATAELKNPLSGQTVEHAKKQYRDDRDAKDQLLSKRALVHFAADPTLVFLTTRLAGKETVFLPFNRGPTTEAPAIPRTQTATAPPICGRSSGSATPGSTSCTASSIPSLAPAIDGSLGASSSRATTSGMPSGS